MELSELQERLLEFAEEYDASVRDLFWKGYNPSHRYACFFAGEEPQAWTVADGAEQSMDTVQALNECCYHSRGKYCTYVYDSKEDIWYMHDASRATGRPPDQFPGKNTIPAAYVPYDLG